MTAMELIERVESAGGQLSLSGAKVVCRLPEDVDHALIELLRVQREAVVRELRLREEYLGKGNSCYVGTHRDSYRHSDGARDTRREGDQASHAESPAPTSRRLPSTALMGAEAIAMTKREGGSVWLDEKGGLRAEGISGDLWAILRQSEYLVRAILRDQICSLRWERVGKDWWRYPEYRWSYPDQQLLPAGEVALCHWLLERGAIDRRCSSAVKFMLRDFCEQNNGEGVSLEEFTRFLQDWGFFVQDGFVDRLVLKGDIKVTIA